MRNKIEYKWQPLYFNHYKMHSADFALEMGLSTYNSCARECGLEFHVKLSLGRKCFRLSITPFGTIRTTRQ